MQRFVIQNELCQMQLVALEIGYPGKPHDVMESSMANLWTKGSAIDCVNVQNVKDNQMDVMRSVLDRM